MSAATGRVMQHRRAGTKVATAALLVLLLLLDAYALYTIHLQRLGTALDYGQTSIWVLFFLALALWAARRGRDLSHC